MPFKFKLSRRLARLKWGTALVLSLPIACVNDDKLGLGPSDELPSEVARVVIAPRSVSLKVGGTVVLTAVALSATGDTAAAPLYWRVSSGTVAEDATSKPGKRVGHYKAPNRSGQDTVVVGDSAGHADTTIVDVNETPVASVSVSPAAPSVGVSETVQLTATPKDSAGNTLSNRPVSWSTSASGVAIVSSSGLVTGVAAGSATITATSEGKSGTATVAVTQNQLDVVINPGESIQQAVDAHPAGTSFLIKAGVHRLQAVSPKQGNAFVGEPGAILSGARLLTQFVREGSYWVATGQTQQGQVHGSCKDPACAYPEDLFRDDEPLTQVLSLGAVGPGKWFFDYAADRVYFYDDPSGHTMEISATPHAFRPSADNVTVRGLVIEKYANPAQQGAIQIGGPSVQDSRSGWIVENTEIRLNHGLGLRIGHATRVVGNRVHHNGQLGIGGIGDNVLVEANEIAYNNTMGYHPGWEAGGTKFVKTRGLVVRGNHVHHNRGPGLWTDIDNIDVLYEGNRITDNAEMGIFHEISYAAVVRNNIVERNGFESPGWLYGAGILIAHSPNVEVYGNTVTGNFNGIAGIQQNRGSGAYGPHTLDNLWVHDNIITMTSGLTGVGQDVGDNTVFTGRNNRFDRNRYCLGSNARYFAWMNGNRTTTEWVDVYKQDVNGTFGC